MKNNTELEVVETIISLLNQCYMIHRQSKNYDEAWIVLQDLKKVKIERDKILETGEMEKQHS